MWFAPASKKRKRPAQQHAKPKGFTTRQGHDADDDTQHFNLFKRIRIQGVGRPGRAGRTQPSTGDAVSTGIPCKQNIREILSARAMEALLDSASQSECSEGECDKHKRKEFVTESENKQGVIKRRTQPSQGDGVFMSILGGLTNLDIAARAASPSVCSDSAYEVTPQKKLETEANVSDLDPEQMVQLA